jgi:hypothetical protein
MNRNGLKVIWAFSIALSAELSIPSFALGQSPKEKAEKENKPFTEKPKEQADKGKDKPADMDAWMRESAAGENHKRLEPLVGEWNLAIKFSDEQGAQTQGKAEFRWVMGGRFLVETVKAEIGGQPFEWMGWHGYDNHKKKYVSVWIDNFGTGIDTLEGAFDESKSMLVYRGERDDPATGGKTGVKWVITIKSKDRFTVEMFESGGNGLETKVMEMVGTRG